MRSKKSLTFLVLLFLIILGAATAFLGYKFYLGEAPLIVIKKTPTHLAATSPFSFSLEAEAGRLSRVKVTLVQGTKFNVVLDQQFGDQPGQMPAKAGSNHFDITLEPKKVGLAQGAASLIVQSWGRPIGDIYQGQMSRRDIPVIIDTVPPGINPVSRSVYLNRGGSALVIYRLSKDVTKHGVSVGDQDYPGYTPWEDKSDFGLCFFALAQDQKRNTPVNIWAEDEAGNRAKQGLSVRVRRKRFRKDRIKLSTRTVARLANKIPGPDQNELPEDIKSFIWINEKLRKKNNATIMQASKKTTPRQLWTGAFLRPRGKPMAGFGDRRTYVYKKKVVTKAVHLGIDLADVSQSKIKAGARGKVIYAKKTGIYGNCIIIDHGLGVASLYAHLSEMLTNTGEMVERGQDIARSGISGLALGDHLHFSILINGVFVSPTEWLDSHWIRDNIMLRYKNAGIKPPLDDEAPQPKAKK